MPKNVSEAQSLIIQAIDDIRSIDNNQEILRICAEQFYCDDESTSPLFRVEVLLGIYLSAVAPKVGLLISRMHQIYSLLDQELDQEDEAQGEE